MLLGGQDDHFFLQAHQHVQTQVHAQDGLRLRPRGIDVRLELFEFFVVYQLEDQVQVVDHGRVIGCIRLVSFPLQHQERVQLRDCGFYRVQRRIRVPEERLFFAE